jgi:signal transduction histidine kinase
VLAAAGTMIEIADAEPRAQMWLGAAAGAVFLVAVPLVRGDDAEVMADRARLLIGAGVAAVLAVIGLWQSTERNEPRVLLLLVPAVLLFVTATLAVREASRSGRALRSGRLRSRLDGQEAERRRWAQELHDQTLQDLAAVEVRLAGLARSRDPELITAGLDETRAMVREQIRSLRHLVTRMRPLALDTLGLAAAVADLAVRAERDTGVEVGCALDELPERLRPDAEVSVYRIVQEAVTNAVRHAACHRIEISARRLPDRLLVTVQDDGIGLPGPDPGPGAGPAKGADDDRDADGPGPADGPMPDGGLGMVGMTERAESLDGELTWRPAPGGGTVVTLTVPLAELLLPAR